MLASLYYGQSGSADRSSNLDTTRKDEGTSNDYEFSLGTSKQFVTSEDVFSHIRSSRGEHNLLSRSPRDNVGGSSRRNTDTVESKLDSGNIDLASKMIRVKKFSSNHARNNSESVAGAIAENLGELGSIKSCNITPEILAERRREFFKTLFGADHNLALPPFLSDSNVSDLLEEEYQSFQKTYYSSLEKLRVLDGI